MSQPMPYTPWDKSWDPVDGDVYLMPPNGDDYLCWFDVYLESRMKRLTNEQGAAEYWRALYARYSNAFLDCSEGDQTPDEEHRQHWHEISTWHRFATTPHAFEVDDG